MSEIAKIFRIGRRQFLLLPTTFHFDAKEIFVSRDHETGNVILSLKPKDWSGFISALKGANVPKDFLNENERHSKTK